MKRRLKIVCFLVIMVLLNTEAFAETTKYKIDNKINDSCILDKLDETISIFLNSDKDMVEYHQIWNKLEKGMNILENEGVLAQKLNIELINILDEGITLNIDEDIEEEENDSIKEESEVEDIFEWDGKDREISLDLSDDSDSLIGFLNNQARRESLL